MAPRKVGEIYHPAKVTVPQCAPPTQVRVFRAVRSTGSPRGTNSPKKGVDAYFSIPSLFC